MRQVTVTGATGFVGSHVAEGMLRLGVATRLWVRRRTRLVDALEKAGAELFVGRPDDPAVLGASMQGSDAVIHCAGATRAANAAEYLKANVELTRRILDLLDERQRFVFVSSQAAAGPSDSLGPTDESSVPNPISDYGRSKLAAEHRVREWGRGHGDNFVILRPCTVYGPRERDVFTYFKLMSKGLVVFIGDGRQVVSLVYIDDLVSAIIAAATAAPAGATYFIAGDQSSSWRAIASAIRQALGKDSLLRVRIPRVVAHAGACVLETLASVARRPALLNRQKLVEMTRPAWVCSNAKAKRELTWNPAIPLEEGMRRTAEWYLHHGWL